MEIADNKIVGMSRFAYTGLLDLSVLLVSKVSIFGCSIVQRLEGIICGPV